MEILGAIIAKLVTVVEDAVTEDLTALSAVDANGNYLVYTSTLSINDVNVELIMYPNHADQFISVKSTEVLSGIRVIDMTGKEVIRKSIQSNDTTLDLGNLNTGIYFLEAKAGKATKTMRYHLLDEQKTHQQHTTKLMRRNLIYFFLVIFLVLLVHQYHYQENL